MAKYLSKAGAIHLVNKVKEHFVSSMLDCQTSVTKKVARISTGDLKPNGLIGNSFVNLFSP